MNCFKSSKLFLMDDLYTFQNENLSAVFIQMHSSSLLEVGRKPQPKG